MKRKKNKKNDPKKCSGAGITIRKTDAKIWIWKKLYVLVKRNWKIAKKRAYPALTAKTPAFGLGLSTKCATSPHANTPGVLQLSKLAYHTHITWSNYFEKYIRPCEVGMICLLIFMVARIILIKWLQLKETSLRNRYPQSRIRSLMFEFNWIPNFMFSSWEISWNTTETY